MKSKNDIQKFQKFLDSLVESYNSPVDITWIEKENLIGLFCVNDKVYQINCIDRGDDIWTYKFYLYDVNTKELLPELTNFNVGKMAILSTVRKGMVYLVENKSPRCLIYAALDDSEARKKLYLDFSRELEREYGYTLNTASFGNKKVFVLYKNIEPEKIEYVMKQLVDEIINDI